MKNPIASLNQKVDPRIILWILIAAYTYILPEFRTIYNFIVNNFGGAVAGRVPLVLVVILAVTYIVVSRRSKKGLLNLLYLVPGAIIAGIIMTVEPNPNKHIHIPQYVLMAWLLYAVLSRDMSGKRIFLLVYIYASLLGVVDELEQGVHPSRFYGWSDMIVNTSSAVIGIFTIMGLRRQKPGETESKVDGQVIKRFLWLILPGLIGALVMCLYLWQAHLAEMFPGYYPGWMLVWNILYLVAAPIALIHHYRSTRLRYQYNQYGDEVIQLPEKVKTARLWTIPLIVILFYMHAIPVFVALTGAEFI